MNAIQNRMVLMFAAVAASLIAVSAAVADPLDSRDVLKFSQQPMNGTPIFDSTGTTHRYWGHDELSTAYSRIGAEGPTPYRGTFMADDFADKFSTPVVHVKWWGSYLDNFQTTNIPVDKFLISFERDVPADPSDPNSFSRPGEPILNQIVRRGLLAPGSGTFTEELVGPGGPPLNESLYEYNAELHLGKEFLQEPNTVYWLKIVALVDLPLGQAIFNPFEPPANVPRWGWHNRDYTIKDPLASTPPAVAPGERLVATIFPGAPDGGTEVWHFQDDAVTGRVGVNHLVPNGQIMPLVRQPARRMRPANYLPGIDGPSLIGGFSKDLAFELYTIPEPGAVVLMMIGLAGMTSRGRRLRLFPNPPSKGGRT